MTEHAKQAANPDALANVRLFVRERTRLYSILRMSLGGRRAATEALAAVQARASASLEDANADEASRCRQLTEFALAEIGLRNQTSHVDAARAAAGALGAAQRRSPDADTDVASATAAASPGPTSTAKLRRELARGSRDPGVRDALALLSDDTLQVMVRGLAPNRRQAVALVVVCELPAGQVVDALGVNREELGSLISEGLADLTTLIRRHGDRERSIASLAARPVARLVPLPPGRHGVAVIRGARVYLEDHPPQGVVQLLLAVLERIATRLRRHRHADPFDDDVGESHRHSKAAPPLPTPTAQPIKRPQRTPSLTDFKRPEPTAGTAHYGRSPQGTPSTERLSTHRNPLGRAGAAPWVGRR